MVMGVLYSKQKEGFIMGICYIIGAADAEKIEIKAGTDDFIICADGGLEKALRSGINPALTVGDFDSYGKIPDEKNVIVHPVEKDDTDSMLAVKCGLERGYRSFVMYGMLGGRLDHTFANIQLLAYICEHGGQGILAGETYSVTAVKNGKLSFKKENEGMISVFSLSNKSVGIDLCGLKYSVSDFTLLSTEPMGVSNEFKGIESSISVKDGILAVMWEGNPFLNDAVRKENR